MDDQGSSSAGPSSQYFREQRNERPLPPFPPFAQQKNLPAEPMDSNVYQQLVETGEASGSQDVNRQYELWRESGFEGTPGTYSQNESPLPPTPPDTLVSESRGRGNSAPQIQTTSEDDDDLVNETSIIQIPNIDGRASANSVSFALPTPSNTANVNAPRERPPSQSRYRRMTNTSTPTEVVVPRWQPDAEVTICPICHTQFSFFIRKHHCRKCGRVVCNACSPHRITIPYQYIVQLPVEGVPEPSASSRTRPARDPARAGSAAEVASLGGGERVRLCNPCVPDPNTAPPQTDSRIQSPTQSNRPGHGRSVSGVVSSYSSYHRTQTQPNRQIAPISVRDALRNSPGRPGPSMSDNLHPRGSSYSLGEDPRSGLDIYEARSRSSTVSGASRVQRHMGNNNSTTSTDSMATTFAQRYSPVVPRQDADLSRPLPSRPQPRQQIPEEDECWICHHELPSRTLPNFETIRAQHVEACLRSVLEPSSSSSSPPPGSTSTPARPITNAASSSTPNAASPAVGSPKPAQRRTGVFPYVATEKDCVDDAECTICLEEFEVGVEMGRLECFCRFHLRCIRDWFGSRPGQCPVHQHGGGY
ncbi:hypothetical protein HYALB_00003139 [Hymenoscyphus albidus]|uniref:RING-type E3 ubiquitin transferase n=1 Tax=Hymenoscyphus albidus TaxID=595503 RepID=A0A9N9Q321_9HELO|nr:hypothetical protein HYALB_00003139 [Hymenoscyphus albidus]